jgi:GNAT superfamily N-acetyltransferase
MAPQYLFATEVLPDMYSEMEPLARAHYQEYSDRLAAAGVIVSPYNPRLDEYFTAARAGHLKTFTARYEGELCGYANVYLTSDMHNRDFIAQEDVLYVAKEHRGGLGRKLVAYGLGELRKIGVKRLSVSAVTDARVAILWGRMGFKGIASQMVYIF